jgi:hypothetical protein
LVSCNELFIRVPGESEVLERAFTEYSKKSSEFQYRRDLNSSKAETDFMEVEFQTSFLRKYFSLSSTEIQSEIDNLPVNKGISLKNLSSDNVKQATYFLHSIILKKFRDSMGMTESPWHPSDSFNILFQELVSRGPLMVQGHFHKMYYKEPAKFLGEKFGDKEVYQYPPGSAMTQIKSDSDTHAIVIVGARKGVKKDLVFYIDPTETSINLQVMSYDALKTKVFNIRTEDYVINGLNIPTHTKGPFLIGAKDYSAIQLNYSKMENSTQEMRSLG